MGRTIVARLCGIQNLQSVASIMSFFALDGLMMGTCCGALDPSVLLYMMEVEHLTPERVGKCCITSRVCSACPASLQIRVSCCNARRRRPRSWRWTYVRRIVREIGAMTSVLTGLDMPLFTAGIGEYNADIRQRVAQRLAFLGVRLDDAANQPYATVISPEENAIPVLLVLPNEEWMATRYAQRLF